MEKTTLCQRWYYFLIVLFFAVSAKSQNVDIPDSNFEQALIDLNIDNDGSLNGIVAEADVRNIEVLDISNKNISSLDGIEAFQNLKYLYAYNNEISSIDVSANTSLIHLSLNNNSIANLDVTNNPLLEELHINNNGMNGLSLANHPDLFRLHAGGNQLSSIDLSGLPKLNSLILWGSELSLIDLSNNPELVELVLDDNNLDNLDVSANSKLEFLFVSNNRLKSLNIANGSNSNFTSPDWNDYSLVAQGNPDLECIQVDGDIIGNIPDNWVKDFEAIYSSDCNLKPEYVHIPDPNFEQALIDLGIDSDQALNSWLLLSDAESVTNLNLRLPISFPYGGGNTNISSVTSTITNLTGIEAFIHLQELMLDSNDLENLDLSNLSELRLLYCRNNNLTQIDLSQNTELKYLYLSGNALASIDLNNNPDLEEVSVINNDISQIDVSANSLLKTLQFSGNPVSTIDTRNLPQLEVFYCGNTNITSLDLSNNLALKIINIDGLPISELDVSIYPNLERLFARNTNLERIEFSKNPNLLQVWIEHSSIKTIDLSSNPSLYALVLDNNTDLQHLDLRNENNLALNFFGLENTPNLKCINADAQVSQAMTASGKSFSTDCGDFVEIPDANFEQALIDSNIDSDGVINHQILRSDAENVTDLNVTNPKFAFYPNTANQAIVNVEEKIQDLTGLEAFINITKLSCWENALTQINLSQNTKLVTLELINNEITSIDVSGNPDLEIFWLEGNALTEVDVSNNTKLKNIALGLNEISALDISKNTALNVLTVEGNNLSSIDVSNNTELKQIWLADNPDFEKVDFSKNSKLYNIGIYNTSITTLDLSNTAVSRLFILNNPNLEHLDLRNGNNASMQGFLATNTPNLTCINADEIISQAMIDSGKSFSTDCGDFVEIPDPNFEQSLIDLGIDSDGVVNNSILREDAETVTDLNLNNPLFDNSSFANNKIINVKGKIADLTGIEAFVNLVSLQSAYGTLMSVDVSQNTKLEELFLNDNQLSGVDISMLPNLKRFGVMRNPINGTVDVSNNTLLEEFFVHNTGIDRINLSSNSLLWNLYISDNELTQLDISNNTELKRLSCQHNNITQLDITNLSVIDRVDAQFNPNLVLTTGAAGNPTLKSLNLSGTGLSNFNGAAYPNLEWLLLNQNELTNFNVNNNIALQNLFLNDNSISKLNLSSAAQLLQLQVNNNVLEELDLRNGNNMQLEKLSAIGNFLTCISVDDPTDASMPYPGWELDSGVTLNLNCKQAPEVVLIPDPNFEKALIDLGFDTNGENGALTGNILLAEAEAVTVLNLSEKNIVDATGIEAFVNLTDLDFSNNALTAIDLSQNSSLVNLNLSGNGLSTLFINSGKKLISLKVSGNQLNQVNFGDLSDLGILDIAGNKFEALDFRSLSKLTYLNVSSNNLTKLDLRNGNNASISFMDATENYFLNCIGVDDSSNIPGGWNIDLTTNYTNTGDCESPNVYTKNIIVSLDRYGEAVIDPLDVDNGSADAVTAQKDLIFELDILLFSCANIGNNQVVLSVTDASGNTGAGTAIVTVVDEIAPEASSLRTITLDLNGSASVSLDPTDLDDGSLDNCGDLEFSVDRNSFSFPGSYEVLFNVTDASGNSSTSTTNVEVVDSQSTPTSLKFKQNLVATVYPNPFSDHLRISFNKSIDLQNVQTAIYTMNSNLTNAGFEIDGNELLSTGAGNLPNASYILSITINGQTQTAIIVKE